MARHKKEKPIPAVVPVPIDPEVMNDTQTAALLSVMPRTLRLWRNTRGLPHIKISSKVIRYKRTDVLDWLDRSRTVIAA